MKSSIKLSLALVSILAVSSVAFAQGRASAPANAQGAASIAGTQTRIHTPGTGLTTDATPLKTRIHTPGTGLTTTAPVVVPVVVPVVN